MTRVNLAQSLENAMQQKQAIKVTIADDLSKLVIEFSHGRKLEVIPSELSSEIREYATLHGLKQKLIDGAAIAKDTETGKPATIETKFQAVSEILERLKQGSWNKEREGGLSEGGILLTALLRLYADKLSPDAIKEFLKGLTAQEKNALKLDAGVSKVIKEIQKERAPKDIDSKELLGKLANLAK